MIALSEDWEDRRCPFPYLAVDMIEKKNITVAHVRRKERKEPSGLLVSVHTHTARGTADRTFRQPQGHWLSSLPCRCSPSHLFFAASADPWGSTNRKVGMQEKKKSECSILLLVRPHVSFFYSTAANLTECVMKRYIRLKYACLNPIFAFCLNADLHGRGRRVLKERGEKCSPLMHTDLSCVRKGKGDMI